MTFTVNDVDGSSKDTINWTVDGDPQSLEVIVKNNGDDFANVNDYQNKGINNNGNLGRFVSYDKVTGKVTVAAGIIGAPITYTLAVDSKEAKSGYAIADVLPTGMTYDASSFTAKRTTWDADGLNKVESPVGFVPQVSDNTFTGSLDLPASSKTLITYTASVTDEAARVALEAQLQTAADKVNLVNGGNYNVNIKNTATFGGSVTKNATFSFGGSIAGVSGPGLSGALSKNADWSTQEITPKEDGSLDPPLDITYTINTDLAPFDGTNVLKTLVANVILSDNLPVQASWKTTDATFLTSTGIVLDKVAPVDLTAFAGDEYVGKYFVDGQKLYVNVGMDNTLKSTIAVKAQISTVMGLNNESNQRSRRNEEKADQQGRMDIHNRERQEDHRL
ncbi:hypothetical protein [Arthrobacter psychrolactophilus]